MSSEVLQIAAQRFAVSGAEFTPLNSRHVAHLYGFQDQGRGQIMRLIPPGKETDLSGQISVLAWFHHLEKNGVSVATLVRSQGDKYIEVIPDEGGEWMALVMERPEGVLSDSIPLENWNAAMFQILGQTVGKLHSVAKKYVPPAGSRCPDWDASSNLFNRSGINESWLAKKQESILASIRNLPRGDDYVIIHADLRFGNFFIESQKRLVTLFNLDNCCYGWYVMDIAMILFDALVNYDGRDPEEFARHFLRNFLSGYKTENPISLFWMTQLPNFLKLLEINLFDLVSKPGEPVADESRMSKFLSGRQERVENNIPFLDIDYEVISVVRPDAPVRHSESRPRTAREIRRVRKTPTYELTDKRLLDKRAETRPIWRELRILVSIKLYAAGRLPADRAAKIAGVSRVEFLLNLAFYKFFPLMEELQELEGGIE